MQLSYHVRCLTGFILLSKSMRTIENYKRRANKGKFQVICLSLPCLRWMTQVVSSLFFQTFRKNGFTVIHEHNRVQKWSWSTRYLEKILEHWHIVLYPSPQEKEISLRSSYAEVEDVCHIVFFSDSLIFM